MLIFGAFLFGIVWGIFVAICLYVGMGFLPNLIRLFEALVDALPRLGGGDDE